MVAKKKRINDISDELLWHVSKTWKQRTIDQINKVVIHQSMSSGTTSGINHYHVTPSENNHLSKTGCPHIAYHFTIESDGQIYKCNSLTDIVWHTKGQNTSGIGICVLGDFDGTGHITGNKPTDAQLDSCKWLMEYLLKTYQISRMQFSGHSDHGKPACPGIELDELKRDFRVSK